MTRNRAVGEVPNDLMAEYYAQRASAAFIVTEGTQPSAIGQGYLNTPGIHSKEQIQGWRKVTDAVHAADGRIFVQLMHSGRVGHPSFLPAGMRHVAPSPVRAETKVFTAEGMAETPVPVELDEEGIASTIADYVQAARNAIEAGFDGVELHGANGYLLHQFLSTNANLRTDRWGGSVDGHIRMTVEVAKAAAEAIGAHRVGLRISPGVTNNDIREDNPEETYPALIRELNPIGLAYLHIFEGPLRDLTLKLRAEFEGVLVLNPFTPDAMTSADELKLIENGTADVLTFGAMFLANPDLPARLVAGGPYNQPDRATFYGGDGHGYTDYPTMS
jgi:N-ethylmaleimide reductase